MNFETNMLDNLGGEGMEKKTKPKLEVIEQKDSKTFAKTTPTKGLNESIF